ncbi:hypothetical protein GGI15_002776 [Coemansia interrupta]|uniref:DUF4246 domain-containing protein n=1 Tax=Coemansia interrupta TaxID=1126814 RepID=A0A9W8HDG4_9FUNG|nr:hypothetical protein GGI15_002776 [Coemansia interrupta]
MNKEVWPDHRTSNLWMSPVEKRMISASKAIRSTPGWVFRAQDVDTIEGWRSELMSNNGLSDDEATYVIDELGYYASVENACVGKNARPREFRVPVNISECISETVRLPSYDLSDLLEIYSDSVLDTLAAWESGVVYREPSPGSFVTPKRPIQPYSLRDEQIQIFVKMTNVYLSPDKPECAAEVWKSAGTQAEQIVATAMYLYDVDNIEQVSIDLRESVEMHEDVDLRDHFDSVVYGLNSTDGTSEYSNILGSIKLDEGDIVCYPNIYQRRILPLKLSDQTKAGHVKVMTVHFVDPSRKIASTAIVPPQQPHWKLCKRVVASSAFGRCLPEEIQIRIAKWVTGSMSLNEATMLRDNIGYMHYDCNFLNRTYLTNYALHLNVSSWYLNSGCANDTSNLGTSEQQPVAHA